MISRSILIILLIFSGFVFFNSCKDQKGKQASSHGSNNRIHADTARINSIFGIAEKGEMDGDSLLLQLDEAESYSRNNSLDSSLAVAIFLKGVVFYRLNKLSEALAEFTRGSDFSTEKNFLLVKAKCLERMASIHIGSDDRPLALRLYYESLSISEKIRDSSGIAKAYNILGYYKGERGEYDTAEMFLLKAIGINKRLNDRHNMITNEGNLAYVYRVSGKVKEAEKIYLSLGEELRQIDDKLNLPVIYFNLATIKQSQSDNDSALVYLRKAFQIAEYTRDSAMLTVLYGNTGEIFMNMGRMDSAGYYLEKSVLFSQLVSDYETELQALEFLVKIDTLQGNFHEALLRNKRIMVLNDSVFNQKMRNSFKEIELRYENEKSKNQLETQKQLLYTSQHEKKLYLLILVISGIAVILLVLVVILQRKGLLKSKDLYEKQLLLKNLEKEKIHQQEELSRLRLEKANEALQQKNRDLVSIALGIEQKNELLDEISKKLKETVKNENSTTDISLMNQILSSIRMQLKEHSEEDIFNQRFSNIHEEFFTGLKEAFPELTPNELKFCAYLRIHLNGNQIARILNVSSEAIRKTRYRIRKKLNLHPDTSLEDFISGF